MATLFRRFGEWVIGWRSDLFTWARLKLSVLYLLIIVAILFLFNATFYATFRDQRRENHHFQSVEEQTFYDQAVDQIRFSLFFIDGVIFVVAAGLSYTLAGYTLKPIKEVLETQAAFVADASHELRTPLTILLTNTEIILKNTPALPEKTRHLLKVNKEEILSLSTMAEKLLTLSRGENMKPELFAPLDLAELIKATVEKFKNVAQAKKLRLTITELEPATVRGDRDSLEHLLKNILANAITYTPAGGKITVALTNASDQTTIEVADTGIGIAEKDLPHIFKRFYKVDAARTDTKAGSGLGLAIVKQIVENHHGTMNVRSTVGQGTIVSVQIPTVA